MLTMGNYMDDADRKQVWHAVNAVPDATWHDAPFRTDYPLNHIYKPLN